jgi:hypothetical protein
MVEHVVLCERFGQRDGDHAPSPVQRIVILVYYLFFLLSGVKIVKIFSTQ